MLEDSNINPTKQQDDEYEIDLSTLFKKIIFHYKFIVLFGLIGGLAAFIYASFQPKVYESKTVIYPQDKGGSALAALAADLPIPLSVGGKSGADYLMALLKSDSMTLKTIKQLELTTNKKFIKKRKVSNEKVVKHFKKNIKITRDKTGGAISISARSYDMHLSAMIANKIVDNLGEMVQTSSKRKADFISERLRETARDLKNAEDKYKKFLEDNKIAQVDEQSKAFINSFTEIEGKIIELNAEIEKLKSSLANVGNPDILIELEVKKNALESSKQILENKKNEMLKDLNSFPEISIEYIRHQRDLAVLNKTYELLIQQYQLANISQHGEDGDYQVIDRARPIKEYIAPLKSRYVFLGLIIGSLISIIYIFIKNKKEIRCVV
ncbi:MAG: Wzz/FepE/Etk N-terminal domain-containing protein [Armatimonadota bacterium]